ncbi:MAG: GNAT family N-acetyltransferase [Dongiaceae bacterium]
MTAEIPVKLRPVRTCDLGVAAALHGACFADAWNQAAIAELLAMPGSVGLFAIADELPVGLAIVQAGREDAELITLCVLPSHRRHAIGARLLAAVQETLSARGCTRLILEVAEDNIPGKAFYLNRRFRQIGRRAGYYQRGRGKADALVLACDFAIDQPVEAPPPRRED